MLGQRVAIPQGRANSKNMSSVRTRIAGLQAATRLKLESLLAMPKSVTLIARRGSIFVLDTRKSQSMAIVLKSIVVSRGKIFDSLLEGQGLDIDTLEKLNRITPLKEEATIILKFEGGIKKVADVEPLNSV
ncbi:hypothetical protein L1887_26569 [Cichorium endivia]|nr:hypothetical protein L1887_26569 [Cichorium endivia]